jgi:hypothetical protein
MNTRSEWLTHFVEWFFNASPSWIGDYERARFFRGEERRVNRLSTRGDRRRVPRTGDRPADRRS